MGSIFSFAEVLPTREDVDRAADNLKDTIDIGNYAEDKSAEITLGSNYEDFLSVAPYIAGVLAILWALNKAYRMQPPAQQAAKA